MWGIFLSIQLEHSTFVIDIRRTKGFVPFLEARTWMSERVHAIQRRTAPECIWLLEHEPFYARGRSARDDEYHQDRAPHTIPVHDVQRGGKYTYHGPGQRVVYVMIDLSLREKDLKKYVYALEEWLIQSLSVLGIHGFRAPMGIGVWVNHHGAPKKIAAIGVHISKWVTSYGIALNINTDLTRYRGITPCGIVGYDVINLHDLGMHDVDVDHVLIQQFKNNIFLSKS